MSAKLVLDGGIPARSSVVFSAASRMIPGTQTSLMASDCTLICLTILNENRPSSRTTKPINPKPKIERGANFIFLKSNGFVHKEGDRSVRIDGRLVYAPCHAEKQMRRRQLVAGAVTSMKRECEFYSSGRAVIGDTSPSLSSPFSANVTAARFAWMKRPDGLKSSESETPG
ncbi:hypothetical protein JFU49_10345 [Pseudomonas sp. TH03]|uniref:hypothetical protein n=1 Tax=Pseudomonas sp. TH03 TaxID=2796369 RepID=UPI00191495AD|nr:hypothetical protein [Pseudomonas sp. TH03]MBK5550666.1 hypothetical protein [Pseudomonas sp. TH03]